MTCRDNRDDEPNFECGENRGRTLETGYALWPLGSFGGLQMALFPESLEKKVEFLPR